MDNIMALPGQFGKRFILITFLCLLICNIDPRVAFTNENFNDLKNQEIFSLSLEEIMSFTVITATQTDIPIRKAPATIYRYSGNELRRWGIRSIAEIVNMIVPGGILTEDGDETIASFRGVATDNNCKVLTLINGHNVNVKWAKGATPELEMGLLEDIEAVEVIVGPGSALYGSGATIGVINLITKKQNNKGRINTYTSMGTGNTIHFDTYGSFKKDELKVNFSMGGLHTDGYPRRDGSSSENWPEYISRHPLNCRFFLQGNIGGTQLMARYAHVTRSLYNTTVNTDQAANYETWDTFFLDVQHTLILREGLKVRFEGSYDAHQTLRHDFQRGFQTRGVGEQHVNTSAHMFWTPSDRLDIVCGTEYRYESFGSDLNSNNFNVSPVIENNGDVTGMDISWEDRIITPYNRNAFGVYAQGTFQLRGNTSLLGGVRYDYVEAPIVSQDSAITPRIGLVGILASNFIWKAMYTSGFRQAMAILTSPDGYLLGSSNFQSDITDPEQVHSFELGMSYLFGKEFNTSITAFYNRFKHIHSLRSISGGFLQFISAGEVDFVGFEASVRWRLADHLTAQVSHQIVMLGSSKDDPYNIVTHPDDPDKLLFYPENVTKFLIDYQFNSWLSVNTNGIHIYDSRGYQGNQVENSGAYTLLNANLVIGNRKKGNMIISGYNLIDVNPRTPMPGTVGLGSSMTHIAGINFNISYQKEF